jgi:hypothetical protein
MSGVYSTRFLLASSEIRSYLVPAGNVAVVRSVQVCNDNVRATSNGWLRIDPALIYVLQFETVPPQSGSATWVSLNVDMRLVVNPGELLTIGIGSGVQAAVSGYLLTI